MPSHRQTDSPEEYKLAHDKAVKFLSMRLHTRKELETKLSRYKYSKEVIEQVLSRLVELRLIDDEKFAEIFLNNLIRYKGIGYYALRAKLLSRGISDVLASKLLEENLSFEDEFKIAQKVAGKRSLEREKLMATLARKGFRTEVIYKVVND